MWFLKPLLLIALTYTAAVVTMYAMQTRLLFPAGMAANPNFALPPSAERIEITTPDGERLSGVRVPPLNGRGDDSPIILGFGGNAWNADDLTVFLRGLFPNAEIITFHYRGYRPSSGTPSAAGLLSDAPAIYDHVRTLAGKQRIITVGFSLGTGVAAHLAARRPLDGMILVSPFDSLEALAHEHFWWTPTKWLLRHRIPVLELVHDVKIPAAIIAAGEDTLIPPQRTEEVRRALSSLVLDRTIPGVGHYDIYGHPIFANTMNLALARIAASWAGAKDDTPDESSVQ